MWAVIQGFDKSLLILTFTLKPSPSPQIAPGKSDDAHMHANTHTHTVEQCTRQPINSVFEPRFRFVGWWSESVPWLTWTMKTRQSALNYSGTSMLNLSKLLACAVGDLLIFLPKKNVTIIWCLADGNLGPWLWSYDDFTYQDYVWTL